MGENITEDLISPYDKTHIVDSEDRKKAGSVFNQLVLVLDVMNEDLKHREMDLRCKGKSLQANI